MGSSFELLVGSWRVDMATHDPSGTVTRSGAIRSTKRLFGDGRYVREEIAGAFGGARHEKMTVLGYNQTRARFEFFTADNHDGVLLLYTGQAGAPADAREIIISADYAAPDATGAGGAANFVNVRTVITIEDRDRHRLHNYYRPGGEPERLFLDLRYQRDD